MKVDLDKHETVSVSIQSGLDNLIKSQEILISEEVTNNAANFISVMSSRQPFLPHPEFGITLEGEIYFTWFISEEVRPFITFKPRNLLNINCPGLFDMSICPMKIESVIVKMDDCLLTRFLDCLKQLNVETV